ncbi:MAG: ABC transporter ATP-binding protein, partial [Rhodospirillaceae bacterium]
PTNDLDLETLDLLQELLANYAGTVLLVSHDRDFLDRVVTSVIASEGDSLWVDYAGGYTDMLAQRGAPAEVAEKVRTKPKSESTPPKPKAASAKLSYKDKFALETLPGEIADLETEVARLQGELAKPDLFARDPAAFQAAAASLAKTKAELAAAEDRWLELEMRRDEMENR